MRLQCTWMLWLTGLLFMTAASAGGAPSGSGEGEWNLAARPGAAAPEETILPSSIGGDMVLSPGGSPYIAQGDVSILTGVLVTAMPGVEIHLADGASLFVHGVFDAQGTVSEPVVFKPQPGAVRWGALVYDSASGPSTLSHAIIERAGSAAEPAWGPAALSIASSEVVAEHLIFRDNVFCICGLDGDVRISDCDFPAGNANELINIQLGSGIVEDCRFHDVQGGGDAIDFDGVVGGVIRRNTIDGSMDDAIDLGIGGGIGASVLIVDNLIIGAADNGISVGENSEGQLERNLIIDCGCGVTAKNNSTVYLDHCSLYGHGSGVACYEDDAGWGGSLAFISNSIFSQCVTTLALDSLSTATVAYSCSDGEWLAGLGNLSDDPEFADPLHGDLSLRASSPCINAGDPAFPLDADGSRSDMGAVFFDLASQVLFINEINYHSAPGFDPGDWVEFHNPSADHVNLGGLEFQGEGAGEPFLFPEGTLLPPRGYLVLCSDPAAFQVFFPQVQSLIGGLEFPLSDAGETIQVRAPNDQVMDAVGYDDDPPWPLEPGGSGPTLELISPLLDNALPASWAASVGHGTPGALNSASSTTGTLPDPGLPAACALLPAWPNPFNGGTTLAFVLDRAQRVRLSLCDVAGRYVALVADRRYEAGKHVETWNGCDAGGNRLSSGLYLVRMQTAAGVFCRKLLLIK